MRDCDLGPIESKYSDKFYEDAYETYLWACDTEEISFEDYLEKKIEDMNKGYEDDF